MAGSVNKVLIVGNLARDPEVKTTQSGAKIVNMTVATSERWKDKNSGEMKEKSEFHRVVIFNDRLADVAEKWLKKGKKVYLEGSLQTRKWTDQSGQDKYTTEIVLDRFRGELTLLDSANGSGGGEDQGERRAAPATSGQRQGSIGGREAWEPKNNELDDEIPF